MEAASPLEVTLSVASATDAGHARHTNEDSVGIGEIGRDQRPPAPFRRERMRSERGFVLGVYDGCGGYSAGDAASRFAAQTVHMAIGASPRPPADDDLRERLGRAVEEANRRILDAAEKDPRQRGSGSTATVAAVSRDRVYLVNAGDGRAYLLRGRWLTQLTRDDTLLEDYTRRGLHLDPLEDSIPPDVLTRLLGVQRDLTVEVSTLDPKVGDTLLLCTDGLWRLVDDKSLRDTLLRHHDVGVACRVLVDEALRAGGHDNVSVIVARVEQLGAAPAA